MGPKGTSHPPLLPARSQDVDLSDGLLADPHFADQENVGGVDHAAHDGNRMPNLTSPMTRPCSSSAGHPTMLYAWSQPEHAPMRSTQRCELLRLTRKAAEPQKNSR